jgi:hypothetical protein
VSNIGRLILVSSVLAAATPLPAAPAARGEEPTTQPHVSLAARMLPGLGMAMAAGGTSEGAMRGRLRLIQGEIGAVVEDETTHLRVLQRRHRQLGQPVALIEHQVVNGARTPQHITSLAVADYAFAPLPQALRTQAGRGGLTVHAFTPLLTVTHLPVAPDKPVLLTPKESLGLFVIADEWDAGGLALAVAPHEGWRFRAEVDKRGKLTVRVEVAWKEKPIDLPAVEKLRLAAIALSPYRGTWRTGPASMRAMWRRAAFPPEWEVFRARVARGAQRAVAGQSPRAARAIVERASLYFPPGMLPTPPARPASAPSR